MFNGKSKVLRMNCNNTCGAEFLGRCLIFKFLSLTTRQSRRDLILSSQPPKTTTQKRPMCVMEEQVGGISSETEREANPSHLFDRSLDALHWPVAKVMGPGNRSEQTDGKNCTTWPEHTNNSENSDEKRVATPSMAAKSLQEAVHLMETIILLKVGVWGRWRRCGTFAREGASAVRVSPMHLRDRPRIYTEIYRHDTPEIARDSRRAPNRLVSPPPGNNNNIGDNTHKLETGKETIATSWNDNYNGLNQRVVCVVFRLCVRVVCVYSP
ncbi:hypothetical protein GHT06_017769 [Daphnia sinensis]|uniref:Uncharacterized protein n=1 Tax=Daphnia sinensis TaxID=1820382 RepID=A0AAD5PSG1_9CRUS|nr:hypothetical protein GHT06_017769 [Daphnia sinensis]